MRNTQELKKFITRWKNNSTPSKEILYEYRPFCINLMYEDEELVRETTCVLRKNIEMWARANSLVYKNNSEILSKENLLDKSKWYVDSVIAESMHMATSGSTTGNSFSYLRWEPFLYFIEAENHYDLIMDEFEIKNKPDVVYFFNTTRYDDNKALTISSDSDNFMEHHGLKRKANVYYVNFSMFKNDRDQFFKLFFECAQNSELDVIFAPGPSINAICHYLKNETKFKICKLLSNSNEKIMNEDAAMLMDGYVENICDHMRCWDGGATFFTCKHNNYHILDNLSWCESVDGKLVSTDYFSLPSPFVRYWNGDFCQISDTYQRCDCGRLYRDFEFLDNRPFSIKGRSILEIKSTLERLRIRNIKQVRCSVESVEIVSHSPILDDHKRAIQEKYPFKFMFTVEN